MHVSNVESVYWLTANARTPQAIGLIQKIQMRKFGIWSLVMIKPPNMRKNRTETSDTGLATFKFGQAAAKKKNHAAKHKFVKSSITSKSRKALAEAT
ncbi:unnamed protein product [Phytophthora lilii]|uniref:Unnamed protein product n=1 Tax=Phytophthora lilii TaxID=2077276 RepID=A0A9W6WZJ4_9STRA|nr:unnamed protein product [Phytophthora lilii]